MEPVSTGVTLRQWLDARNEVIAQNRNDCCRPSVFGEKELSIFVQILMALRDVHATGIIHRDVKPDNIMVTLDGDNNEIRARLMDFGLASVSSVSSGPSSEIVPRRTQSRTRTAAVGTPTYCAPELMQQGQREMDYGTEVDMYSVGIVFVELTLSFSTAMERAITLNTVREEGRAPTRMRYTAPLHASLVDNLISHEPSRRLTARGVLDRISEALTVVPVSVATKTTP
jgi:serine/threonine protein kinase